MLARAGARGGTITRLLDRDEEVRVRGGIRRNVEGGGMADTAEVRGRGAGVRLEAERALVVADMEVDMAGTTTARSVDREDTEMGLEVVVVVDSTTGEGDTATGTHPTRTTTVIVSLGQLLVLPDLVDRTTGLVVVARTCVDLPAVVRSADPSLVLVRTLAPSRLDPEDEEVDLARLPTRDRGPGPGVYRGPGRTPDRYRDPGLLRPGRPGKTPVASAEAGVEAPSGGRGGAALVGALAGARARRLPSRLCVGMDKMQSTSREKKSNRILEENIRRRKRPWYHITLRYDISDQKKIAQRSTMYSLLL